MSNSASNIAPGDPGLVTVRGNAKDFAQEVVIGSHRLTADEPISVGGTDAGPSPYELVLAGLGACTSMTVAMYARRRQWPLQGVSVRMRHSKIHAEDCASCETKEGMLDRVESEIELAGALSAEQREKLLEIAKKCPVRRTLTSEIEIQTRLK